MGKGRVGVTTVDVGERSRDCNLGSMGMDEPEGAYGAYAYAPGVGLRIASDYYCEGKKKKNYMS